MSATIIGKTIRIARGEDSSFSLHPKNFEFTPGSKIVFRVRRRPDASSLLINKEVRTDEADEDGNIWIRIDREDTLNLEFGRYSYDIWVIENDIHKALRVNAPFEILEEVAYLKEGEPNGL